VSTMDIVPSVGSIDAGQRPTMPLAMGDRRQVLRRRIDLETILITRITHSDLKDRDDDYDRHRKRCRVLAERQPYLTHAVSRNVPLPLA
jgi:hypothetical protein